MKYVGTGRPIHDAAAKAAGAARYAGDISLPHMAHLCLVRSTIPHGYIRAVHAEKALAVPGVYGVFHCFNTTERGFNRYCAHVSHHLPPEDNNGQRIPTNTPLPIQSWRRTRRPSTR